MRGISRLREQFLAGSPHEGLGRRVVPPWIHNDVIFGYSLREVAAIPDGFLARRSTVTHIEWGQQQQQQHAPGESQDDESMDDEAEPYVEYNRNTEADGDASSSSSSSSLSRMRMVMSLSAAHEYSTVSTFTTKVTTLGRNFLLGCVSLRRVDLQPFEHVTSVGQHFLGRCDSITTLDLTPFTGSLTAVGEGFLGSCKSLRYLNVLPLFDIEEIKDNFLLGCVSLERVDGFGAMPEEEDECHELDIEGRQSLRRRRRCRGGVTSVMENNAAYPAATDKKNSGKNNNIPNGGGSGSSADVVAWTARRIGRAFLYGCEKLTSVDLRGLVHVRSTGIDFLYRCRRLKAIAVSPANKDVITRSDFKGNKGMITIPKPNKNKNNNNNNKRMKNTNIKKNTVAQRQQSQMKRSGDKNRGGYAVEQSEQLEPRACPCTIQ